MNASPPRLRAPIFPEADLYALLMKLREGRGCIVSSSMCTPQEISLARALGRMFVDIDGFGYVYRERIQ